MLRRTLSSFVLLSALAVAQEAPEGEAAAPQQPALPEAGSDAARALVEQAMAKTVAYGRGKFRTKTVRDAAMTRNAGIPLGAGDVDLDGGWHGDLVWGDFDGRAYVTANGRMFAKVDGEWRLRRGKLAGGVELPFAFDPGQLLYVLQGFSERRARVVHVQPGKLRGKDVAVLTWKLEADDALELADSGVVPEGGGPFGVSIVIGRLGGAIEPPRPELETYVAFTVDPDNGDLLRLAVRSYQKDVMGGNFQVAFGGAAGGVVQQVGEQEDEDQDKDQDDDGPIVWRRGFPDIKPAKDQSVMTFRVDFSELGLAERPELDDRTRSALRLR